jgi:hypothetical protein
MYGWREVEKVWGAIVIKKHPENFLWMFFSASLHVIDARIYLIFFLHSLEMAHLNPLQRIS